jgi:hypothetical protein
MSDGFAALKARFMVASAICEARRGAGAWQKLNAIGRAPYMLDAITAIKTIAEIDNRKAKS